MCVRVWVCSQVHNAKVTALTGGLRGRPRLTREWGAHNNDLFPVSISFLAVRKWRCMETATLPTRCFLLSLQTLSIYKGPVQEAAPPTPNLRLKMGGALLLSSCWLSGERGFLLQWP